MRADRGEFGAAGQIDPAVGGEHGVEQAEMTGDRRGDAPVRAGREDQHPPGVALCAQIGEQFGVVAQSRRVQIRGRGEHRFHRRAAVPPAEKCRQQG